MNHGGVRIKNARETYVDQLPYGRGLTGYMNKKRKPFTHLNTTDDFDLGYRSTPDYLRQLAQQDSSIPTELLLARNVPRTKSASEMTPRNNVSRSTIGNPKYKAQEDYYDEIQSLKQEMKTLREENSNFRAKIRRLEEDNARKIKEIDALYNTNKDGDLRRTLTGPSTDRNNNNSSTASVVMSLKQRVFKLEGQLKQKETTIDEMKSDPRWTKSTEFEIQNRALFSELERQKVARLNYIQQNDYMATLDEEQKNAVRKLNREKDELRKENENLKKKLEDHEKGGRGEPGSVRSSDRGSDSKFQHKIDSLQKDCEHYEHELEQMKDDLNQMRVKRDQFRDKYDQANEDLAEVKRERDQLRKRLDEAKDELERYTKQKPTGRSSPISRYDDEIHGSPKLKSAFHRPQSPMDGKRTTPPLKVSAKNIHHNSWTADDDRRVKNFREKRAATVIQRGWRDHNKEKNKARDFMRARQENADKRGSRIGSPVRPSETISSPRASVNFERPGSGAPKNRPSSANNSQDSALRTVQASLRGHLNRNEIGKNQDRSVDIPARSQSPARFARPRPVGNDDDDDDIIVTSRTSPTKFSSDKLRQESPDRPIGSSKQALRNDKSEYNNRDPLEKFRKSPTSFDVRSQSPIAGKSGGFKQDLPGDRNKFGSGSRISQNDQGSASKLRRPASPPNDNPRAQSPALVRNRDFAQDIQSDRQKFGSGTRMLANDRDSPAMRRPASPPSDDRRPSTPPVGKTNSSRTSPLNDGSKLGSGTRIRPNERDSAPKLARPSSPLDDRRSVRPITPENPYPAARKSPSNSKQSLKNITEHDDDADVF
ncbi:unnamed protein product [Adineta ricciae]|uniref:Uncharacterized protein n=1 Tax=Adineta ricciae TaxID=249248 RepID=A0A816D2I8_ADIRI|nr:unnamed protein product [Adineta ricciae]CAF1630033.1 unnamed protein product [Adineta ricciae]